MRRIADRLSGQGVERVLWALFLVCLPVTSFPWLPSALGGTATVRPLAIYPLLLLVPLVLIRRLVLGRMPRASLPLLLFVVVAVVGGALAAVQPVPEFRSVTALDRVIRNLLTLALGLGFYFSAALVPRSRDEIDFTIRWLMLGFILPLAWSTLQAFYVFGIQADPVFWEPYFDRLNAVHHIFSTRNLQERRVIGLAYEPSWFAEQLGILVIPWLLAAVMTRRSFFHRRFGRLLTEDLLLVWTSAIMVLTYSRTGLVILFVQVALAILMGRGRTGQRDSQRPARRSAPAVFWRRAGSFVLVAAVFLTVVFLAGSQNRYFSRMWRFFLEPDSSSDYWAYIAFGQRFVYWEAAFNIYEAHPVLGTGVGTFALHFEEALPDIALHQYPEILTLIVPEEGRSELITPKNLFLRVLAETGLVGLGLFLGFWAAVLGEALGLLRIGRTDEEVSPWGRAALLGLAAAFLAAFSTDSFAVPNIWVLMGVITAAARTAAAEC